MKPFIKEFFRRGLLASGFGPLVLAVMYLVLSNRAGLEVLTAGEVCTGIFSLWALAFVAGGMNCIYQAEKLPLMAAILIHGGVLYAGYLVTYRLNHWLQAGWMPLMVFTVIYVVGYLIVWAVIYTVTKQATCRLNHSLRQKQKIQKA